MARSPTMPTIETIKRKTLDDMRALGVHKPQYNRLVTIYAELVYQYNLLTVEFEQSGYKTSVETGQGGAKKSPIVASLETLRKDILAYSDRLCLNPKAMEAVTVDQKKTSKLAAALSKLESG